MRTAIVADLALLGVFKYYDFFAVELSNLLGSGTAIPLLELTLPVGISFFTFQAMSYVTVSYTHLTLPTSDLV